MKQKWASIVGSVEIEDNQITLVPVPQPPVSPNTAPGPPFALVRSNIEFEQGTIKFEALLPDTDTRCQIGLVSGTKNELYAGLNVLGSPYGFASFRNGQWEPEAGAGHGTLLQTNKWYELELQVKGSYLDLYVNGVKVVSTSHRLIRGPISLLLQSAGKASIRNVKVDIQQPICFVVMQFTDEYNSLYSEVIKPTCETYGYFVVRADDFYNSGLIIEDITRSIQESTIVIADVTPNNPNVFYEVGYAHGLGKPTILLSDRKREKLPFDISGFRTLFYDNTIGGKGIVEERLKKHLDAIIV
jgi:hypothetical protein